MGKLEEAIQLRSEGELDKSNELLADLIADFPDDALVNYQYAWSFDVLGLEANAVPYYEKAIQLGLNKRDELGAFIGLGSTYRTLGEYNKSKTTFEKGIKHFPENNALKIFYSMTLYNVGEHSKAMETLLTCLSQTTNDSEILSYKKAIEFYADKLDQTW
ncbi:tetratricopeptide repeat protein [Sporosarcina limicola]|uniref:Tetratricopeptide (TPR) repeat protein n=1 Tax=Sporosarcina limicola TaxID=34101 RepID=A0A927RE21_9BACL|nr:tetratricopeptide repeat protein [Sporosarcina limicola]MBE1554192.1 tetratricopeptide (TPR) repeat protein [Sporosarcina limicola]